ncbi:MAG: hypothetical protein A2Z96_05720 [Spirochaetes bacterium GWB1_48_6]|nr:MAG: hypothetical protein A2Z96_05720 [Spirochaetes bacterium GWB1_48_6]OHE65583.1 MAG: hypothetical protein A2001_10695 [Treponema sp. GWC1_61_84]OHE72506.1 MAG: hypothetical protein A2413_02770 [Treponema sp. RIFOXYC1_FULL_61_9]HCM26081.1 hypothetical protein [Treponema sp.]
MSVPGATRITLFYPFLLAIILVSCAGAGTDAVRDESGVRIRTRIESEKTKVADILVYVEGADGDQVTGAVVVVRNSANDVVLLPFDPVRYCYAGSIAIAEEENFSISVDSILLADSIDYSIPHVRITEEPVLAQFRDSSGRSVLAGENLDGGEEIQVAWSSRIPGSVYQVSARTALETVYSVSTEAPQVVIPAGTFASGSSYYLQIQAQKIFGDPLFRVADYYSVATFPGSSHVFNCAP